MAEKEKLMDDYHRMLHELAEVLDKDQARAIAMRYGRSKKDDNVKIVMQEYRRSELTKE